MEVGFKMIKIFGVGNSFTEDAFTWLSEIAAADGIEIMTVVPFVGGCTFKRHLDKIKSDSNEYDLIVNGKNTGKKLTFDEALAMEDWDFVTFNQGSVQSGRPISYFPYLNELKEHILKHSPNVKPYIYQTWAYETDATHPYYYVYNNSQKEMWIRARDCYHFASRLIDAPIIPVGEVIQYLRENVAEFDYQNGGMSLNRDGYHLTEIYGRYVAGLTFYFSLFKNDILKNSFIPEHNGVKADPIIIEKIKNAVYEVVNNRLDDDDD